MSVTKRMAQRLGVVAGAIGLATTFGLATANAADSIWWNEDVTCHVFEQISGPTATADIRWYTDGGASGCRASIWRNGVRIENRVINTTGTDNSSWYFAGTGNLTQVVVYDRNGVKVEGTPYLNS